MSSSAWYLASVPAIAAAGAGFTLTINGSGLLDVQDIEFHLTGMAGGMGPGGMEHTEDSNIKVTNMQVNTAGTQITASVQILPVALPGPRQIGLETERSYMMGPMFNTVFTGDG